MRPYYLSLGAAAFTLMISMPVYAQYTQAKGDSGLMEDTRRIQTEDTSVDTTAAAPATTTQEESVSYIEPASGRQKDTNPYDDFTGFYAGGDIGYAMGSYDINDPAGPDGDVGLDGINGGVFLGYGFEHSFNWLGGYAGLELGHEWSDGDGDLGTNSYEKNRNWLVTFRPGISMHEDALGYGIIGYSRAEFEGSGEEEDLDGLVLGAGAEFDTNTAFKTRLEYTYTNYEDSDFSGVDFDGHENNIKLGLLFRM